MRVAMITLGVLALSGCSDASFEVAASALETEEAGAVETATMSDAGSKQDTAAASMDDAAKPDTAPSADTGDTAPKPEAAAPVEVATGMNCDPRSSAGCGGNACDVKDGVVLYCRGAGSKTQGAMCNDSFDCAVGYSCIGTGAVVDTCRRYCRMGVAGDCESGSCASPLFTHNGETYGTCS